ncbi:MAG: GAF domain-containing protein [Gammaproteobacteria bacterium]|nr:GAF domain-containing protein [Gammaproteobacteria bacterium]
MKIKIKKEHLLEALRIQTELSKEHDIDKLLPLIIGNISELLGADRTNLFLFDDEETQLQTKVAQGVGGEQIVVRMNMGIVGTSVLINKCINLSNANDNRYFDNSYDDITGYATESLIAIPIADQNAEVIGAIEFLNHKNGSFSQQDEETITEWAKSLIPYLTNPETSSNDLKGHIDEFVTTIGADRGSLFKLDPYTSHLISLYGTGLTEMPIILDLGLGVVGHVAITGKTLVINDAQSDPRFDSSIDDNAGYITTNLIAIPLLDSWDNLIGIIEVKNKLDGEEFDENDVNLLTLTSRSISIAMENAILLSEHDK